MNTAQRSIMKLVRRDIWSAFALGGVAATVMFAIFQDYLGKEDYIAYIQERWVDMHWLWWVPLFVLIVWHLRLILRKYGD